MTKRPTSPMQNWYTDEAELQRWGSEMARRGLYPTEAAMVAKHFTPGATLLNIGCGGGREASALSDQFKVVAVDFSGDFCTLAKCRLADESRRVPVMKMDALSLAIHDETFDHVMMVGQLIGMIPGGTNRIAALREIHRVMRPGAVALVSTNAIELGLRYRAYFALVNAFRKFYNPHDLDPDDAFIFRQGGRWTLFSPTRDRAVFHWYRTKRFLADCSEAGFECLEFLRRFEYEGPSDLSGCDTGGETFYALKKRSRTQS